MSARSDQFGQPKFVGQSVKRVPGWFAGPRGQGEFLPEPAEHPGVAHLRGDLHRLPRARPGEAFQGDQVRVGAERPRELARAFLASSRRLLSGSMNITTAMPSVAPTGIRTGSRQPSTRNRVDNAGGISMPDHRVQHLLAVQPCQRNAQECPLLVGCVSPHTGGQHLHAPAAQALGHRSVARFGFVGTPRALRRQPQKHVTEVRPRWHDPPHQCGRARADQATAQQRQLKTGGDHREASSSAFCPMKRGNEEPADMRFIHTSTPTYAASSIARIT